MAVFLATFFFLCSILCIVCDCLLYVFVKWTAYLGQDTPEKEIVISVSFLSWLNKGYNNSLDLSNLYKFALKTRQKYYGRKNHFYAGTVKATSIF